MPDTPERAADHRTHSYGDGCLPPHQEPFDTRCITDPDAYLAEHPIIPVNVRMVWIDADCPPAFEWTEAEVNGSDVFGTWTEAKARALSSLRDAKDRVSQAIASTQRMTRADVSE